MSKTLWNVGYKDAEGVSQEAFAVELNDDNSTKVTINGGALQPSCIELSSIYYSSSNGGYISATVPATYSKQSFFDAYTAGATIRVKYQFSGETYASTVTCLRLREYVSSSQTYYEVYGYADDYNASDHHASVQFNFTNN